MQLSDKNILGMMIFVVSEFVFFTVLILAFVFYRNSPANIGGPTDFNSLDVARTAVYTACLTASSFTLYIGIRNHKRGHMWAWHLWLALTILLGGAFVYGEAREFGDMSSVQGIVPSSDLFGSTFYALVGFHGFHVSMGIILLLTILVISLTSDYFRGGRHSTFLDTISIYWIFVDAMWWIIFPTVYLWSLGPHGVLGMLHGLAGALLL